MLVLLGEDYKMKKLKGLIVKNRKKIVILLIIILIIIFLLVLKIIFNSKKEENSSFYDFSDEFVEIDGTKKYTSDKLSDLHCLNDICISEVVFSYINNNYGVQYVIKNNSSKKASGYLYMKYGKQKILLAYSSLEPGKSKRMSSSVHGAQLEIEDDYTLVELTSKELKSIHVSN